MGRATSFDSRDGRNGTTPHRRRGTISRRRAVLWSAIVFAGAALAMPPCANAAGKHAVARGKYLVSISGCGDCHTPGHFFGKPDMSKFLGGSDVGFAIPHLGVFVGPNLTPDKATGLGNWTAEQIVAAITEGQTPQGRKLAPVMPYEGFKNLTKSDALAIAAYLKSLPPVSHQVPGPFGPNETPTSFVMTIVPGAVYAHMNSPPPPPAPPAPPAQAAPPPAPPASAPPPK
jgi:mono/diheme cytochrome c family protein